MDLEDKFYSLDRHAPLFLDGSVRTLKKKIKNVKVKDLENFLNEKNYYTLNRKHMPVKRNSYFTNMIDQLWEMDLISLIPLAKYNDDCRYILTVIDVFSKYAFAQCLKTKQPNEIVKKFDNILKHSNRKCLAVRHDAGREFMGVFSHYLQNKNIRQQFTQTTLKAKAAVVEAFNRNLRQRIHRFLYVSGQLRYIDMLPRIIDSYNDSWHSTILMSPSQVNNENTVQVYNNIHRFHTSEKYREPKLKVNDLVRTLRKRQTFDKPTFQKTWSDEIFRITKVKRFKNPTYELEDLNGHPVKGTLYEEQMLKVNVSQPDVPIKKIRYPTMFENDRKGKVYTENIKGEKEWLDIDEIKSLHKNSTYKDIIDSILK